MSSTVTAEQAGITEATSFWPLKHRDCVILVPNLHMGSFPSSCSVVKDYLFQGPAVNMQESYGFAGTFGHDVINDVTVSPDVSLERCQWLLCFLISPVQIASKNESQSTEYE